MTPPPASDSGSGWRATVRRLRAWAASLAAAPTRPFPWRKPRRELLLLALVAVAALSPVYATSDAPRVCLAEALLHGHVSNDRCFAQSFDRSSYDGRLYSDKAPGLGLLDVPSVALLQPGLPASWPSGDYMRLWGIRVLSVGIAFLLCAFLVGRVVEGLAPGFGAPALVTLALGTIMAPLATTSYEHDLSALAGFAAFLLAWRRAPALAGLAAGAAFLVDYEAALTLAILGAYVALQGGRALVRYLVGTLPGLVVMGAYDWAAFGAPWRLSYRYVDNVDAGFQGAGFFGIGSPHLFGLVDVFAGRSGLLIVSPVLVAAAYGLVLLYRERPAEALVCATVTVVFTLANIGYFQPYGGETFGPRFLVPSLPFLALGLGPAFRSRPVVTSVAAVASVIATTGLVLVWASHITLRQTIWGELARLPFGSSQIGHNLTATVLSELGTSRAWGAGLIAAAAATAVAVALGPLPWRAFATERRARRRGRSPRELALVVACVALVAGADTCAAFAYPYGDRTLAEGLPELSTSITASGAVGGSGLSPVGGEVNFVITVTNAGRTALDDLSLAIDIPAGLRLLGTPAVGPGADGCNGDPQVGCYLVSLAGGTQTAVRLGVVSERPGSETLTASASSDGVPAGNTSSYTVHAFT